MSLLIRQGLPWCALAGSGWKLQAQKKRAGSRVRAGFACHGVEIQAAFAGISRAAWRESLAGLPPRELAMNVAPARS